MTINDYMMLTFIGGFCFGVTVLLMKVMRVKPKWTVRGPNRRGKRTRIVVSADDADAAILRAEAKGVVADQPAERGDGGEELLKVALVIGTIAVIIFLINGISDITNQDKADRDQGRPVKAFER